MQYKGELAHIQQTASRTEEFAARRAATLQDLSPSKGETILEVGCGSGLLTQQIAHAVGPSGRACAIDLSEDQIEAARQTCAGLANVELQVGSALALPYPAASFDAVASIQVLEYLEEVEAALTEMRRVLKPGGRFVNFATNWGSLFWNSREPARMQQMLKAWDAHAPYPNLPATLRSLLTKARFSAIRQSAVSTLNTIYDPNAYSYWLARLFAAFAAEQQLMAKGEAEQWLEDLADVQERNEYLFCLTGIVTRAVR